MKKKMNNKGFSLVELIVVVAIMAVLMAVLVPTLIRNVEKTRIQKDKSAISEIHHAIELAIADEEFKQAEFTADGITIGEGTASDGSTEPDDDELAPAGLFDITNSNDEVKEDSLELAEEVESTVGQFVGLTSTAMTDYCHVWIAALDTTDGTVIINVEYGNKDTSNDDYECFFIDSTGENEDATWVDEE